MINPWYYANICKLTKTNSSVATDATEDNNICDISELQAMFDGAANTAVSRVCSHLFICGETTLTNSELSLETQNIFLTPGAEFTMLAPPKGSNGQVEGAEDEQGEDGGSGENGKNIELIVLNKFLTGSESQISVTLFGEDGGDGGRGGNGRPGVNGKDGAPGINGTDGTDGTPGSDGAVHESVDTSQDAKNCSDVLKHSDKHEDGSTTDFSPKLGCCKFLKSNSGCCYTYSHYQDYVWRYTALSSCDDINATDGQPGGDGTDGGDGGDGTDGTPGHDGGKGGNGGNGGNAGEFILDSDLIITGTVHKHGGKGGQGGPGGARGMGSNEGIGGQPGRFGFKGLGGAGGKAGYCMQQTREFHARDYWKDDKVHCYGGEELKCREDRIDEQCGKYDEGPHGKLYKHCEGIDGARGADGVDGKPGVKGKDGKKGAPGNEGLPGEPGNPGNSIVYQF